MGASAARHVPPRHATAGVTLFELLVALTILATLLGALMASSIISGRFFLFSEESIHVQQQARQAISAMSQELRQARDGTVTTAAGRVTFQIVLGYNLPLPCPVNAVCLGARDQNGVNQQGWSYRYRLNGTQLVREILNGVEGVGTPQAGTRVLANDVNQVTFTYAGGTTNTLTIALQIQRTSSGLPGGSVSVAPTPLVIQIRLRNV